MSKSLEDLAREVARVQGQPAGKAEEGGSSDVSGANAGAETRTSGFWTRTPPFAHDDRSCEVAEWKGGMVTSGAKS